MLIYHTFRDFTIDGIGAQINSQFKQGKDIDLFDNELTHSRSLCQPLGKFVANIFFVLVDIATARVCLLIQYSSVGSTGR